MGRIFIRCDGGHGDGLGHVVRCVTLAHALRDCGADVRFLTWSPDGIARSIVARNGFSVEDSPAPAAHVDDLAFVVDRLSQETARPQIVLDSRSIENGYVAACASVAFVACIDDDLERDLPCNILINNNVWATGADYDPRPNRRLLLGAQYNLVKSAYFEASEEHERGRIQVLLTMGGEDPFDQTSRLIKVLRNTLAACELTVIVGPAHPNPDSVLHTARKNSPLAEVVIAPTDLTAPIARADLAITAGGTTCYELAAGGVAQAALILDDHQEPLVRAMVEHGCMIRLGRYDGLDVESARRKVADLVTSAMARRALAEAGRKLFDMPGAPRTAAALLDIAVPGSTEVRPSPV